MSQEQRAVLLLPGPNWWALQDVAYLEKDHKGIGIITKATMAQRDLDGIEKLLVLGEGDKAPKVLFRDLSVGDLVEWLAKTKLKAGQLYIRPTTITGPEKAEAGIAEVQKKLAAKGLKAIKVSGMQSPPFHHWTEGGEPKGIPFTVGLALLCAFRDKIDDADKVIKAKWKEDLDRDAILKVAREVADLVEPYTATLRLLAEAKESPLKDAMNGHPLARSSAKH